MLKIAKNRFDLVHTFWFCHLDPIFEDQGGGILRMYPHFQGGGRPSGKLLTFSGSDASEYTHTTETLIGYTACYAYSFFPDMIKVFHSFNCIT